MSTHSPEDLPPELAELGARLDTERAQMTTWEHDRVSRRIAPLRTPRPARRGLRNARLGVVAVLTSGALLSGGGVAMGVSALNDNPSASAAQYGGGPGVMQPPLVGGVPETPPAGPTGSAPAALEPAGSGPAAQSAAPGAPPASPAEPLAPSGAGTQGAAVDAASSDPTDVSAAEPLSVQPARQIAVDQAAGLPFTGYAAVPMLLGGVVLLLVGGLLRRRSQVSSLPS